MQENLTRKNIIIIIVLVLVVFGVIYNSKKSKVVEPVVTDIPNIIVPSTLPVNDQEKARQEIKSLNEKISSNTCIETGERSCYDEHLQLGIKYESLGQLSDAIASYRKASAISPKDYVPYSNIGSAYYGIKKFAEAETAFLKAIDITPNNVSVYTKLYDLYFHGLKRYPHEMNAFFTDAMKNTNNDINIVKLYALYLEEINDLESALPIWEGLLKVEPDNALYKAKIETLQKKIKG